MAEPGKANFAIVAQHKAPPPRPERTVVVTGSGFSSTEREVLKEWVRQLGLQYSGDLVCNYSTHLVCKSLLAAFNEPKYVKAVHWGITRISFRWVYDSLQAGRLLPTPTYKSDAPGPAHAALHDAVALRLRLATLQQQQSRPPLAVIGNQNQVGRGLVGFGADVKALVLHADGSNHRKRPAGQEEQAAAPDDFTFDVPSRSGVHVGSPRLCHAASTIQPEGPFQEEESSGHQPVGTVEGAAQQAASVKENAEPAAATASDAAAGLVEQPPNSPQRNQSQPPTQSPSAFTIEISPSELDGGLTVNAVGGSSANAACTSVNGDSITPTSGVSYDAPHVVRRSAAVQPTKLDMLASSAAPGTGCKGANGSAAVGRDASSPAGAAASGGSGKQATIECIDLLTPTSDAPSRGAAAVEVARGGHADPDGVRQDGCDGEAQPVAGSSQQSGPERSVLYSGFESLAEVATVTKSRRLVRNDKLLGTMPGGAAWKASDADEELHSQAHEQLEDDLEDELNHDETVCPNGPVHAAVAAVENAAVECRRGAAVFSAAAPSRPSLANSKHSVKDLLGKFQPHHQQQQQTFSQQQSQRQQQQQHEQACVMGGRGHDRARFFHMQMPAGSVAASLVSESNSNSTLPLAQQQQQRQRLQQRQQGPQPGALTKHHIAEEQSDSAALAPGPFVRIKPEPVCEAEGAAQVGPVAKQPSSQRRTAAALGTSSLVSEPLASCALGGIAGAAGRSRLGRTTAAAAARSENGGFEDLDGTAGGCRSDSLSDDTPTCLEDLDLSAEPTPSFDSGSRRVKRPGSGHQELALDGTPDMAQGHGGLKGKLPGPHTINRLVNIRTAGMTPLPASRQRAILPGSILEDDSDDEEDFITAPSGAGGSRTIGHGRARNAASVAAVSKVRRQRRGDDSDTATETADARGDGSDEADDDDFTPALGAPRRDRSSSLTEASVVSLSQSQSDGGLQLQQWPRQPLAEDKTISKYLRMSVRMAEEYLVEKGFTTSDAMLCDGQIRLIKGLARVRNQTILKQHPGVRLKDVKFAEQVLVEPLELLLNCRDRSRRARCPIIALSSSGGGGEGADARRQVFLAEPVIFYQLPSGEWWLEYYRYYSQSDLRAMVTATGRGVTIPTDFCSRREIMRDTDTAHCRIVDVRGNMPISRPKNALPPPATGRSDKRPAYFRFIFDTHTGMPLTDQRAPDFVIE